MKDTPSSPDLIGELEKFSELYGLAPATVCVRAVGNSRLYARLKEGGDCGTKTLQKARDWMAEYRSKNPLASQDTAA